MESFLEKWFHQRKTHSTPIPIPSLGFHGNSPTSVRRVEIENGETHLTALRPERAQTSHRVYTLSRMNSVTA
ncbi:hypothetical protein DPEC_G00325590 [Dallia pectoralis]|uniref:Uncharacterized protein n=1 Tax=Dallia pectoralis TaxID=75939 RepID=A0ACC2F7K7_DALPE|nr:hypothetical protein DPEC_G00325590 [Dallia pectoralis]